MMSGAEGEARGSLLPGRLGDSAAGTDEGRSEKQDGRSAYGQCISLPATQVTCQEKGLGCRCGALGLWSLFLMPFYWEWGALVGVGCLLVGRTPPTLELGYFMFRCPHLAHRLQCWPRWRDRPLPGGWGQQKHHDRPVRWHLSLPAALLLAGPLRRQPGADSPFHKHSLELEIWKPLKAYIGSRLGESSFSFRGSLAAGGEGERGRGQQ